jgi:hypothetical protein
LLRAGSVPGAVPVAPADVSPFALAVDDGAAPPAKKFVFIPEGSRPARRIAVVCSGNWSIPL